MNGYYFLKKYSRTLWQLVLLIATSLIFACTNGLTGLMSALLGGSSWLIPNLYFRRKINKAKKVFDSQKMLKYFMLNEAIKLLLSFGMIILILSLWTVNKKSFLISYVAMVFASLIIPWRQEEKDE